MPDLLPVAPGFGLTPELVAFVERMEVCKLHAYLDPVGLPTIGYGHRIPTMAVRDWTQAQAYATLLDDLRKARDAAVTISPVLAGFERRLAAITDFCFNLGPVRYATSKLRAAVDLQEWSQAAAEMRKWVYAHDEGKLIGPLPGLVTRRQETARWLQEG